METQQESERPVNIIKNDYVNNLIACGAPPDDLEKLAKHELGLLVTYYELDPPIGSNRHPLLIVLGEATFNIPNPSLDESQREEEPSRPPSHH